MSNRAGHSSFSPRAAAWLAALSDPCARRSQPAGRIAPHDVPLLLEAAAAHGVMPAVARNLESFAASGRGGEMIDGVDAQRLVKTASDDAKRQLVVLTGQTMLLLHHAERIAAAFAHEKIPANIVKGMVFARRLYPRLTDRTFTDVDILVSPSALEACAAVLQRMGFALAPGKYREEGEIAEYKWGLPGNDIILVEIQINLIHSPNLASGVRFRHSDLLAAGDGDAEDATALLLLAAVHGAAGHQFERLQPAVDVLQAVRGAAGPIDRARLAHVAHATGSMVALQAALDLTAELFDEPAASDLANSLSPAPWRWLRRKLVSPGVVLRAQARNASRDSWRRRALREIIRRTGKATIGRGAIVHKPVASAVRFD